MAIKLIVPGSKASSDHTTKQFVFQQYSTKILFSQVSAGISEERMEEPGVDTDIHHCEHSQGVVTNVSCRARENRKRVYHSESMNIRTGHEMDTKWNITPKDQNSTGNQHRKRKD